MNGNYYNGNGRVTMTLTTHLVVINALLLLATYILGLTGLDLTSWLGLHYWGSERYHFWQPLTYMFMHGGFMHLFFNMWTLFMFGPRLEAEWGRQRYLLFYLVSGLGAALMQQLAWRYGIISTWMSQTGLSHGELMAYAEGGRPVADYLVTVGASGSVFGILLGYGMTYPNDRVMLLMPPIPLKVKWLVIGYGLLELYAGVHSGGDGIAHFAHLGGMLFGLLLLLYWRHNDRSGRGGYGQSGWGGRYDRDDSGRTFFQRIRDAANAVGEGLENFVRNVGRMLGISRKPRMTATPGGRQNLGTEQRRDMDYNERQRNRQQRIDEILDKIREHGYDRLTPEEKQFLFDVSQRNQK